ncbi:hypothetical protein ABZS88_44300 [Streptomyces sp. NPDC005480]|uniref:hypothetical protein n=1 Tax=Streptomyces sp. NPDC005480 TaxID=3154880 RepID=UPI0033B2C89A
MLRPELYETEGGEVTVDDAGRTTFHPQAGGAVRRVVDADLDAVAEEVVSRIERTQAVPRAS